MTDPVLQIDAHEIYSYGFHDDSSYRHKKYKKLENQNMRGLVVYNYTKDDWKNIKLFCKAKNSKFFAERSESMEVDDEQPFVYITNERCFFVDSNIKDEVLNYIKNDLRRDYGFFRENKGTFTILWAERWLKKNNYKGMVVEATSEKYGYDYDRLWISIPDDGNAVAVKMFLT